MAAPLAGVATFLFVAILAGSPAIAAWLQARLSRQDDSPVAHYLMVIPALWVLAEWLRGTFLSGFPWLHLGYSQVDTPFAGFALWLGVYGVSLVSAVIAGWLWRIRREGPWILAAGLALVLGGAIDGASRGDVVRRLGDGSCRS